MKRIKNLTLAWSVVLLSIFVGAARASTPTINGASVEPRTFNDCAISTLTVTNHYPASIEITDAMSNLCVGFANLHSFSFSADGGATAAAFNNNSNYRFSADVKISGAGEGEGGLRLSPWYGKFVDGRFMINATTGEIACFGGALPFYSFTGSNAITYTRGTTIHLEAAYRANDLDGAHPATIQYRVVYNHVTYDSPVLSFNQANPTECDPRGEWGMLNDGRVGGYFQPRANTGASLTINWSHISFLALPALGTPIANAATLETRTFNDCGLSTLNTTNNYPALVRISDEMSPLCVGFANLHSFSFSEDGGATAADFDNNAGMHYSADFTIDGAGEGEGGMRLSPWYGPYVDGRFMCNVTSGEIACFGGALPFYSFTANHAITYVRGTTIRLDVIYNSHDNIAADPATIRYRVVYNGNTYDSPVLPFGQQNPFECDHGIWGMLNDGRAGGYFQPRANTGAALAATWGNIRYSACPDPVPVGFDFRPRKFNHHSKSRFVTVFLTPNAPHTVGEVDLSSVRLNGVPLASNVRASIVRRCQNGDDDHGCRGRHHGHGEGSGHGDGDDDNDDHGGHCCPNALVLRFDRAAFNATLNPGDDVPVVLSGTIGGDCFEATTEIRVRAPHMGPHDHDMVAAGSVTELRWDPSEADGATALTLVSSADDGATWSVESQSIPNNGLYRWTAPATSSGTVRLGLARIEAVDETGVVTDVEVAESGTFVIGSATGVGNVAALSFALNGVTPNPARGAFRVAFTLPVSKPATLAVYDVSGRQVALRAVGGLGAGRHSVALGATLRPGLYLVRLEQAGRIATSRVAVIE